MARGTILTDEERDRIIYLGLELGLNCAQIERATGRSDSTASRILDEERRRREREARNAAEEVQTPIEDANLRAFIDTFGKLYGKITELTAVTNDNNRMLTELLKEWKG